MPFSEQLYYNLLLFTLGCAFLAFFYHVILYLQRKEALLFNYCIYLFFLTAFLLCRAILVKEQTATVHRTWSFHFWDELLQLLLYYGYIEFIGKALGIQKNNFRLLYKAWKFLSVSLLLIAFLHSAAMLLHLTESRVPVLFRGSRALLILISLLVLLAYATKKTTSFQRYILAGSVFFLISGLLAFASFIFRFTWGGFYALSFTFPGEIADVLLFSAAMGYRLRLTYEEKEQALQALEEQRELNRQKDLEKLKAIIEIRDLERNRIARELHDEVGSSLSSINIFSTVADQYLQQSPAKAGEMVNKIKLTSGKIMESMSDLVWAINAQTDDTPSLVRRIRQFASSLLDAKNIRFEIEITPSVQQLLLKTDAKKNILLVCKEAVNNIAKYSQATQAIIQADIVDGQLYLYIEDNGTGFTPGIQKGNGLLNMKNRCEESGGSFDLRSSPGKGTAIHCFFSLTRISN